MKYKHFGIFALTLVSFVFLVASASALTLTSSPTSAVFSALNQSTIFTVSSSGNSNFSFVYNNITSPGSASFTVTNTTSTTNVTSASFNVSLSGLNTGNFIYGTSYSVPLNFTAVNSSDSSITSTTSASLNYTRTFCSNGDLNDSNVQMYVSISNNPGGVGTTSSSSTSWNALDTITVQVTLYNQNSNFNLNNVAFDLGLFQQGTTNNQIGNMIWPGGSYSSYQVGTVGSNSNAQITFTFKVNPQIISNQGAGSYYLMVRAYGNQFCIDHSSNLNDNFGNSAVSGGYAQDITINQPNYNNVIIVDTTSLPLSTQVSCGQQVTLTPNVYNLGYNGNTYSTSQVLVTMSIPDLGINMNQTLYGNLNAGGAGVQVPFTFTVPINATQKTSTVYFRTYYGYNSQYSEPYFGNYQFVSQNTFNTLLGIQGSCVYATPETTQIVAQLQSGGKAGSPLVIQSTITNTGDTTVNYNFGLEGYSPWASVSNILPMNITLSPGQSQDITLNLNVNSDASGNKLFYIDIYSNGYLITKQPLSVTITPQFSLSSITGGAISGGNWYLWGIGLFNVILVIFIIVIIAKVRKK